MGQWAGLLDSAVKREPLVGGWSGSGLERFVLTDGRVVVAKRISPEWDVIMEATGDDGRLYRMWTSGIFARVPAVIDHAMMAIEPEEDGWLLVMRDVSNALVLNDAVLSRAENGRILHAMAALHETFWEEDLSALRLHPLDDHFARFSPVRVGESDRPLDKMIARGWGIFAELVPADVAEAVSQIHRRPDTLANELDRHEKTLIHGDFRLANMGLDSDRVILLDWGTLSAVAPPSLEFGYYLAICWSQVNAGKDEIIEDYKRVAGPRFDSRALGLALILALAHIGWNKAIVIADEPDRAKRHKERANLDWWIDRVRTELEVWSPV
jgi:hypothetical protein